MGSPNTKTSNQREEFEAWSRSRTEGSPYGSKWAYERDTLGNYCNGIFEAQWQAWQACAKTSKPKPDWTKLGESERPKWTNPKAPPVDTKREKHRGFKI